MRPILYLNNRISDGFLILHDGSKDRYFIYLNLYSQNSRFAQKINLGGLVDIRTGIRFPENKTNTTGLIFPINFSREFHFEGFMDRGFQLEQFARQVKSASAKLMERDGRFEVHVTFEFKTPKIKPKTFMGVDRGIYNLASMCVADEVGRIIEEENFSGRDLRFVQMREERRQKKIQRSGRKYKSKTRLSEADKAVHAAANKIVEMAVKHNSVVVLENLSNLTKRTVKRRRSNLNRLLNRSQYTKLQSVLEYKLPLYGVPVEGKSETRMLTTVAAQGTSQTCPECGHWSPDNRKKRTRPNSNEFVIDTFLCVRCGYWHDAHLNAARIIALKKKWRLNLPKSRQSKKATELRDTKYSFECCLTSWADERGK